MIIKYLGERGNEKDILTIKLMKELKG